MDEFIPNTEPIVKTEKFEVEFNCYVCNERFQDEAEMNEHQKNNHNLEQPDILGVKAEFFCYLCSAEFHLETELQNHLKTHEEISMDETESPSGEEIKVEYNCYECGQGFKEETELEEHLKSHQEEEAAQICKKPRLKSPALTKSTSKVSTYIAVSSSTKPKTSIKFGCLSCNKTFKTRSEHLEFHKNNTKLKSSTYHSHHQCIICKKIFNREEDVERHKPAIICAPLKRKLISFNCNICRKTFDHFEECEIIKGIIIWKEKKCEGSNLNGCDELSKYKFTKSEVEYKTEDKFVEHVVKTTEYEFNLDEDNIKTEFSTAQETEAGEYDNSDSEKDFSTQSQCNPWRVRSDPRNWKRNVNKIKRQSGQAYVNTAGKVVPPRELKSACTNCSFKCGDKISEEDRRKIFEYFWLLTDAEKCTFYASHVKECKCKTGKKASKRKFFREYYLPSNGICYRVCTTFFLNTIDVSMKRVQMYFKRQRENSNKTK